MNFEDAETAWTSGLAASMNMTALKDSSHVMIGLSKDTRCWVKPDTTWTGVCLTAWRNVSATVNFNLSR